MHSFPSSVMSCRASVLQKFALKGQIAIPIAINTEIPLTWSAMGFLAPSLLLNFEKPPDFMKTSELKWVASCSKLFIGPGLSCSKKLH